MYQRIHVVICQPAPRRIDMLYSQAAIGAEHLAQLLAQASTEGHIQCLQLSEPIVHDSAKPLHCQWRLLFVVHLAPSRPTEIQGDADILP